MRCNATLVVLDGTEPVRCMIHKLDDDYPHGNGQGLRWNDDAPGATPHQDPTPTYVAVERENEWRVIMNGGARIAAIFIRANHPNPEAAAKAHAAYLNGDGGPELAARVALERMHRAEAERDEARAKIGDVYTHEANLFEAKRRALVLADHVEVLAEKFARALWAIHEEIHRDSGPPTDCTSIRCKEGMAAIARAREEARNR